MRFFIALILFVFPILSFSQLEVGEIDSKFQKMLERKYDNFELISPIKAEEKLNKQTIFLDTRTLEEFERSHIPGAIFVDYENFEVCSVDSISKDTEIIVYCSIGLRSQEIGEKLQNLGYSDVKNLYGGIFLWANQSRKMLDNKNSDTDKVHGFNKYWGRWVDEAIVVYE